MFIHHAIGCVKEYGVRQKVELRGPMGTGLDVQSTGTHVVFAAGTGILVFIDIIAHLILRILAANGGPNVFTGEPEENLIDINNFKLILHTSFPSREDAIGLDLAEILESLCVAYGYKDLFEHNSRITHEVDQSILAAQPRWDTHIQLNNHLYLGAKRIWICGPPLLLEYFDRAACTILRDKIADIYII